jgi:hypothetical protein
MSSSSHTFRDLSRSDLLSVLAMARAFPKRVSSRSSRSDNLISLLFDSTAALQQKTSGHLHGTSPVLVMSSEHGIGCGPMPHSVDHPGRSRYRLTNRPSPAFCPEIYHVSPLSTRASPLPNLRDQESGVSGDWFWRYIRCNSQATREYCT